MNMQGWMKLSGAVCILWGAAGTGIWFAGRYRQRILELEQLKQMVFLLKGQILYAGAPLPEAFGTVGRRVAGTLGNLFQETAALLEAQPGEHLGFLDRETQERTLLLYLEQVDTELLVLREHKQERCRLYTSLGVMGGLFLAVILV